jgi:hypothetical protein
MAIKTAQSATNSPNPIETLLEAIYCARVVVKTVAAYSIPPLKIGWARRERGNG